MDKSDINKLMEMLGIYIFIVHAYINIKLNVVFFFLHGSGKTLNELHETDNAGIAIITGFENLYQGLKLILEKMRFWLTLSGLSVENILTYANFSKKVTIAFIAY